MTEHHVIVQDTDTDRIQDQLAAIKSKMNEVALRSETVFAADKSLLQLLHRVADDIRYMSDCSERTVEQDIEMTAVLCRLDQALIQKDRDCFFSHLTSLNTVLKIRESSK